MSTNDAVHDATPFDDRDFGGEGEPVEIPDRVQPYSSRDDHHADQVDTAPFAERIEPIEETRGDGAGEPGAT